MSLKDLQAFLDTHNSRLVGRSTREIAERFELSRAEALDLLQAHPDVREHPKMLWTYLLHIEPIRAEVPPVAKRRKPREEAPAASPVPSPLSQWERT